MRFATVFIASLLVVAAFAEDKKAEEKVDNAKVETLTDADYEAKTHNGEVWFVKHYAPWCGHCKALAPTWKELSLATEGKYHVAEIDCTANSKACATVKGYPTVRLFTPDDEEPIEYEGSRTLDDLKAFVKDNADLSPKPKSTGAAGSVELDASIAKVDKLANKYKKSLKQLDGIIKRAEEVVKKDEDRQKKLEEEERKKTTKVTILDKNTWKDVKKSGVWLIKFFAPWCGHCKALAPTWEDLAKQHYTEYKIAEVDCVANNDICSEVGVKGFPTIKMFADGFKDFKEYEGDRTVAAFDKFVKENAPSVAKAAKKEL